ncbi:CocE/NonD family hydrolase [Sphingomonas sp.]|uniref:CocE/NonD family hydrolase n=1 Tax=Sphingomonas sp. TaxID=28214 RepID=UPI0025DD9292|nr:CocE/NonD family hydrolase [Sphingomonas sp.]
MATVTCDDGKLFVPTNSFVAGPERGILSAFIPGTETLPAGYRLAPMFKSLTDEIVFERDVPVVLRDGLTIYVDVFRPAGIKPVPALVAWSPYGKAQGTAPDVIGLYGMLGMDVGTMSGLAKFEGPDPAYWCPRGYAVCNPDPRGIGQSEGDSAMFGTQEGQDCHDLIEWLAEQTWCSGKVGMSGTSYLANAQWFTAAEQPPHLAAINPVEGFSDMYRDLVMRGGIPDLGFAERLRRSYAGKSLREDIALEAEAMPLMGPFWEHKAARYDRITVPAYVVASYSNTLHCAGTFRAWRQMASEHKWLRIHNTQEWPDYYDEGNLEHLCHFFDRFLKDEKNGWDETPPVLYAVHDFQGGDTVNHPAGTFPPETVTNTKYFLNGASRALTMQAPVPEIPASYDTATEPALVSFVVRFDSETLLVGYPKVHLWVEAAGANDMELFLLLQKLDAHGSPLSQFTIANQSARMQDLTEGGSSILRYRGADGRLRVSARRLDPTLATEDVPVHSFDRVEKLAPGEAVEVQIELLPIGMRLYAGEQLRLVISGRNLLGPMMPMVRNYVPANTGQHIIHTGGARASYLQLPVVGA